MKPKKVKAWAIYNENDELTFLYEPKTINHGRMSIYCTKKTALANPNGAVDGVVEVEIRPIIRKPKK